MASLVLHFEISGLVVQITFGLVFSTECMDVSGITVHMSNEISIEK